MSKTVAHAPEIEAPVEWHTTADVAKRYRTSPGTVRYWRHVGTGPKGVKVGRRVLYSSTELARFDAQLQAQALSA